MFGWKRARQRHRQRLALTATMALAFAAHIRYSYAVDFDLVQRFATSDDDEQLQNLYEVLFHLVSVVASIIFGFHLTHALIHRVRQKKCEDWRRTLIHYKFKTHIEITRPFDSAVFIRLQWIVELLKWNSTNSNSIRSLYSVHIFAVVITVTAVAAVAAAVEASVCAKPKSLFNDKFKFDRLANQNVCRVDLVIKIIQNEWHRKGAHEEDEVDKCYANTSARLNSHNFPSLVLILFNCAQPNINPFRHTRRRTTTN